MANLQCIMYFQRQEGGWSEVVYASADKEATVPLLQKMMKERIKFLSADCYLLGGRIRVIGKPRDAVVVPPFGQPWPNQGIPIPVQGQDKLTVTAPGESVNRVNDCLVLRCEAAAGNSRNMFCHGIADQYIVGNSLDPTTVANLYNKVKLFTNELEKAPWSIKVNGAAPAQQIIGMVNDPANGGQIKVSLNDVTTFATLGQAVLNGTGVPYVNGSWRIYRVHVDAPPAPDGYIILRGSQRYNVGTILTGTCRPVTVGMQRIATAFPIRLSDRNVGRPFGQQRGHKSAKILHR